MWTLIVSLFTSVFGFALAYLDHGEAWKQFITVTDKNERRAKAWKLTCLWGTPIFAVVVAIIAFFEANAADRQIANLSKEFEKHAPRTISQEQRNRVLPLLRAAPVGQVAVRWPDNDPETANYAQALIALFSDAGIKAEPDALANMYGVFGVECAVNKMPPSDHALAITAALKGAGIVSHLQAESQATAGITEIWVGPKPVRK